MYYGLCTITHIANTSTRLYDRFNMTANLESQQKITQVMVPALEALAPLSAAYLNEADINQPNWQQAFYGANYAQLLAIKRKYDPRGLFWSPTAVGSEGWQLTEEGRLCPAGP